MGRLGKTRVERLENSFSAGASGGQQLSPGDDFRASDLEQFSNAGLRVGVFPQPQTLATETQRRRWGHEQTSMSFGGCNVRSKSLNFCAKEIQVTRAAGRDGGAGS